MQPNHTTQARKDLNTTQDLKEKWGVTGYLYIKKETGEIHIDGEEEAWEMKPGFLEAASALKTEVLINNVTARRAKKIQAKLGEAPLKGIVELRDRAASASSEKTFLTHLLRVAHHPEMLRRLGRETLPATPEEAHASWNAPKHPIRNGILLAANEVLEPNPEM